MYIESERKNKISLKNNLGGGRRWRLKIMANLFINAKDLDRRKIDSVKVAFISTTSEVLDDPDSEIFLYMEDELRQNVDFIFARDINSTLVGIYMRNYQANLKEAAQEFLKTKSKYADIGVFVRVNGLIQNFFGPSTFFKEEVND